MEILTNEIKSITPKYNDFFLDDQVNSLTKLHSDILQHEESLYSLRSSVFELEKKIELMKKEFKDKSSLFNIEYNKKSVNAVPKESNGPLIFKNGRILKG